MTKGFGWVKIISMIGFNCWILGNDRLKSRLTLINSLLVIIDNRIQIGFVKIA